MVSHQPVSQNYQQTGAQHPRNTRLRTGHVLIFLHAVKMVSPCEGWCEGQVLPGCRPVFLYFTTLPHVRSHWSFIAGWKLGPQIQADLDMVFHVDLDVLARLCVCVCMCVHISCAPSVNIGAIVRTSEHPTDRGKLLVVNLEGSPKILGQPGSAACV